MSIKVSVIMPTYNAIETIEKAVQSLLYQSYQNFEIIIVDDQSKDGTMGLLKLLKKSDSRIQVYQNEKNRKSAYTRNRAIQMSTGEYVMQLDDDDYCDSKRMEKQVNFLKANKKIDFVGSNCYLFDAQGVYGNMKFPKQPSKEDLLNTSPFMNPSVMFRRESLEKVNGYRVSKETIRGQDYDLYLRMYSAGLQGYNIQENLIFYYKDSESFKKSSFSYRVGEAKFRFRNFKKLKLFPKAIPYVI
ncbi:MAG: glycosyltransferase family 2 protein, partial [Atopostipes suicloacalis]|nr:glycosyltransferase family 2 protein [Atopostipes suicloacalis]